MIYTKIISRSADLAEPSVRPLSPRGGYKCRSVGGRFCLFTFRTNIPPPRFDSIDFLSRIQKKSPSIRVCLYLPKNGLFESAASDPVALGRQEVGDGGSGELRNPFHCQKHFGAHM